MVLPCPWNVPGKHGKERNLTAIPTGAKMRFWRSRRRKIRTYDLPRLPILPNWEASTLPLSYSRSDDVSRYFSSLSDAVNGRAERRKTVFIASF